MSVNGVWIHEEKYTHHLISVSFPFWMGLTNITPQKGAISSDGHVWNKQEFKMD